MIGTDGTRPVRDRARVQLWLLRHGETEWSRSGQHTGLTDLPLTPDGERSAVAAATALAPVQFDRVLTSPLKRARRTAELAGYPEAEDEPDAVEWDYGDYEGISTDIIHKDVPGWSVWTHGAPNGESIASVAGRADRVISRVRDLEAENVLLVAHSHFLRLLTARWLMLDPRAGHHFLIGTGKVCTLGWDRSTPALISWGV